MLIEVFDPVQPERVFVYRKNEQQLAAVIDGADSWGMGKEAAELTCRKLRAIWSSSRSTQWTPAKIADDIAAVAQETPVNLRDLIFGWSFSVTVVLCSAAKVQVVAAGLYRVDIVGPQGARTVFRPAMLIDKLLTEGVLTPAEIPSYPHRNVCTGPFVGDKDKVQLTRAEDALSKDEALLVTRSSFSEAALAPNALRPDSAASLAALSATGSYPCPAILVRA